MLEFSGLQKLFVYAIFICIISIAIDLSTKLPKSFRHTFPRDSFVTVNQINDDIIYVADEKESKTSPREQRTARMHYERKNA